MAHGFPLSITSDLAGLSGYPDELRWKTLENTGVFLAERNPAIQCNHNGSIMVALVSRDLDLTKAIFAVAPFSKLSIAELVMDWKMSWPVLLSSRFFIYRELGKTG